MMGHSFGAAATVTALADDKRLKYYNMSVCACKVYTIPDVNSSAVICNEQMIFVTRSGKIDHVRTRTEIPFID